MSDVKTLAIAEAQVDDAGSRWKVAVVERCLVELHLADPYGALAIVNFDREQVDQLRDALAHASSVVTHGALDHLVDEIERLKKQVTELQGVHGR